MDTSEPGCGGRPDEAAGSWAVARRRSIDELNLHPGQRVLDVGCSPADSSLATLELARRVGPAGQVRGADHDVRTVEQADAQARAAGVAGLVAHLHAHATALPWPEAYFDAARCLGLLQSLLDPGLALDELLRVTRSGGRLLVADVDWATLSIECGEPGIERRLARHRVDSALPNPFSGRRLNGQMAARQVQDLRVQVWPLCWHDPASRDELLGLRALEDEALASGVLSSDELQRWRDSCARCAQQRAYGAGVNLMVVTGRRP